KKAAFIRRPESLKAPDKMSYLLSERAPGANDLTYDLDGQLLTTKAADNVVTSTRSNGYSYDNAGNRITATTNGSTNTYSRNAVNEYTAITGFPAAPQHDSNGN